MADTVTEANAGLANTVRDILSSSTTATAITWFFIVIIALVAAGGYLLYKLDKKKYNKKIEINEIIGDSWVHTGNDTAKTVKLGKSGFQILYLKKTKSWRIAFGSRAGVNIYAFYIMPDGYWYNGRAKADLYTMDKNNGLVPVIATNPTMRAQYTALEKQIEELHGQKPKFWDKYGNWVLTISFVLIIGILAWLIYKEMAPLMGQYVALADKMTQLIDKVTILAQNLNAQCSGGTVIPAT